MWLESWSRFRLGWAELRPETCLCAKLWNSNIVSMPLLYQLNRGKIFTKAWQWHAFSCKLIVACHHSSSPIPLPWMLFYFLQNHSCSLLQEVWWNHLIFSLLTFLIHEHFSSLFLVWMLVIVFYVWMFVCRGLPVYHINCQNSDTKPNGMCSLFNFVKNYNFIHDFV